MLKNYETRVTIDGAPCSGKSTMSAVIQESLRTLGLLRSNKVDIFFLEEAWKKFDLFANFLFDLFKKNGSLTPESVAIIKAEMAKTDISSIASSINSTPERVFKTESRADGQRYYWNHYTLLDVYQQYQCDFLEKAIEVKTLDELRKLMQAYLLIIQAHRESRTESTNQRYSDRTRPLYVCDGSLFSIINYWPGMSFQDYLETTGLPILSETKKLSILAKSYEVVILLETLANLTPKEYEQYFFDGRRLDTPEDARQLHTRLVELVKDHPCHFIIPARLSEAKKVEIVMIILEELRKILMTDEELRTLKKRVRAHFNVQEIKEYFI